MMKYTDQVPPSPTTISRENGVVYPNQSKARRRGTGRRMGKTTPQERNVGCSPLCEDDGASFVPKYHANEVKGFRVKDLWHSPTKIRRAFSQHTKSTAESDVSPCLHEQSDSKWSGCRSSSAVLSSVVIADIPKGASLGNILERVAEETGDLSSPSKCQKKQSHYPERGLSVASTVSDLTILTKIPVINIFDDEIPFLDAEDVYEATPPSSIEIEETPMRLPKRLLEI